MILFFSKKISCSTSKGSIFFNLFENINLFVHSLLIVLIQSVQWLSLI